MEGRKETIKKITMEDIRGNLLGLAYLVWGSLFEEAALPHIVY